MFDIKWSRDKLICKMTEKPDGHKLIVPSEMSCEIVLNLGAVPGDASAKALVKGMEKTFNALAMRKAGNFIKDIKNQVRALGAVIEKSGQDASKASGFLTKEEADLKKLWKNWSEKLAPKLAEEALQEVVKTAREKDLKGMNTRKAKAVGRVIAVPTLSLAAAAASILTGNVTGASSGLLKAASAVMKAADDLSSALNGFDSSQAAVEKDIADLAGTLKTIAARINSMDKQRKSAEMELAALKSQQRVMAKELGAQKNLPADARKKAAKVLMDNEAALKAMISGLPATEPLKESLKNVAAEHRKMINAIGSVGSDTPKSLRTARDLADGSKELLSILSKMT
jgi:chromosome segregation ATPase